MPEAPGSGSCERLITQEQANGVIRITAAGLALLQQPKLSKDKPSKSLTCKDTVLKFNGGSGITAGFNSAVGTHIVYLDFSHKVDVEIHSATQIKVHNGTAAAATGNVTLIW